MMQIDDKSFLFVHINAQYGAEYAKLIQQGLTSKRISSFRINTLKSNYQEIEEVLKIYKIPFEKINYIPNAYILKDFDKIQNLEIYKDGKIYLQSLSSMLPPLLLSPKESDHILDMAAAPGSKTSQIAALTNNKACITAVEINPLRAERLKYNLEKQGVTRVTILIKDARFLDDFYRFNKILLDAPCSGSGTLNLNIDTKQKINQDIIKKCQNRQITLLKKAISLLPKGGELIYSTCSIFKEENEEVIKKFLDNCVQLVHLEKLNCNNLCYLPSLDGTLTILPNEYFEGFFIAKLRKL